MSDDVTVRLTEEGPIRFRGGGVRCERGETTTTNAEHAALLVEKFGFEENAETCQVVKSDGEVCGRELPCAWHSDEDGEDKDEGEGGE